MIAVTRTFGSTEWVLLAVVILLLVCAAVLALAETSLVRTSRAKAKALADAGHRGGKALQRLVEDPEGFRPTEISA